MRHQTEEMSIPTIDLANNVSMQLLVLALVIGIFVHDMQIEVRHEADVPGWGLLAVLLILKVMLAALFWLICHLTKRRLHEPRGRRWLRLLDRASGLYRCAVLLLYGLDLFVGALRALRLHAVDTILLDEFLFMLPTLLLLAWNWWSYYPIDRRLREAAILSRIDAGLPIHPIWTRGQYLLAQLRHQIAMILVPLLVILAWEELVRRFGPQAGADLGQALLTVVGVGCVFLVAPVMIRYLWDTVPLPDGPLRQTLMAMCRQYRVGFQELLLWRTFGGMVNAAVMGLFAPVRYVLLTDALLEMLTQDQIEAVMAHELAHVRRQHLLGLLVFAFGFIGLLQSVWMWLVSQAAMMANNSMLLSHSPTAWKFDEKALAVATTVAIVVCWVPIFGWVSRRFERQADTFALQHLTRQDMTAGEVSSSDSPLLIRERGAESMIHALQQVAELNNIPVNRRSWRHGSIVWRQVYLRKLVGQHVDNLAIDRQVRWIKVAGVVALVATIVLTYFGS